MWRGLLSLLLVATPAVAADVNVVTDTFERKTLGGNWSRDGGNPGIVHRSDLGILSGTIGGVSWVGTALGPDAFSACTISGDVQAAMRIQVFGRRRAIDGARYGFHWNPAVPQWELKYDGVPSAQTRLLASSSAAPPWLPGDTLRIEVTGTPPTIRGFQNSVQRLEATDTHADQIATGPFGVVMSPIGGASQSPACEVWQGGSLAP